MNYRAEFDKLEAELRQNDAVEVVRYELREPDAALAAAKAKELRNEAVAEFYRQVGSVRLEWQARADDDPDVVGRLNILPLDRVLADWKGDVYFEDDGSEGSRPFFHPVDFFVPEAAAGILILDQPDPQMFLYTYDDQPLPLGVDFGAYIELLLEARAFLYWQMVCADLKSGGESAEARRFRQAMPRLFPSFDVSAFERRCRKLAREAR